MRHVVGEADTAIAVGSGDVPVLATPRLLALAEAASVAAVTAQLAEGQTSVGTAVSLEYRRACPLGAEVSVEAELTEARAAAWSSCSSRALTPMSGWCGCSLIRRGGGMRCGAGRIFCRGLRRALSKGLHHREFAGGKRSEAYGCVVGPAVGCGGVAIKAELLAEYVTGAVLDALESPCVQQALRDGGDQDAPRRADLLVGIEQAQETRAQARRDFAEGVIDREDWLDIRQRTEDRISTARREYDRWNERT